MHQLTPRSGVKAKGPWTEVLVRGLGPPLVVFLIQANLATVAPDPGVVGWCVLRKGINGAD